MSENLLPRKMCRRMDQIQEVKIDSQRNKKTHRRQGKKTKHEGKERNQNKKEEGTERTREEKKKKKGVRVEGEDKREG